jgi:hypothetical protein
MREPTASILFIHAHPGDAEILAGGTLALPARPGHPVTIASSRPYAVRVSYCATAITIFRSNSAPWARFAGEILSSLPCARLSPPSRRKTGTP